MNQKDRKRLIAELRASLDKVAQSPSMGQLGGHRRAEVLSRERRSQIARKAARARWKKAKRIA